MGTWGYGPYDNDDASDLVADLLTRHIRGALQQNALRASQHYNNARAAANIVLESYGDIQGAPSIPDVIRVLARIRCDVEWLSGMREPKLLARALNAELQDAWEVCKESVRTRELGKLIGEALHAPIPKSAWPAQKRLTAKLKKLKKTA